MGEGLFINKPRISESVLAITGSERKLISCILGLVAAAVPVAVLRVHRSARILRVLRHTVSP